jgi:hypothetical protein
MGELGARALRDFLAGEMLLQAVAGGAVVESVGFGLAPLNQALDVVRRHGGGRDDQRRRNADAADRRKILEWVVGKLVEARREGRDHRCVHK